MPRLKQHVPSPCSFLPPVLTLSLQHCFLPWVLDLKFIAYRGLVHLPFALMLGMALTWRPSLLPYLVLLHVALDVMAASPLLSVDTPRAIGPFADPDSRSRMRDRPGGSLGGNRAVV